VTFTHIINIRLSIKGSPRKTFMKWGCRTQKFEKPWSIAGTDKHSKCSWELCLTKGNSYKTTSHNTIRIKQGVCHSSGTVLVA